MPNESGAELIGADEAFRDFRRWADQLGPAVEQDATSFASSVAGRVASKVPRLSGALAGSVGSATLPGDDYGVSVFMGDGLPYAGWIEFGGSRGRPAVPSGRYLNPTAKAATDEFARIAESTTDQTIKGFPWNR